MSFPAKILLFGEHTVLRGGRGLAIPFPKYSLQWAEGAIDERLLAFAAYLKENFSPDQLLTTRLERELRAGLHLSGDIPTGYGLGSSGAVCAAVWDRYGIASREKLGTRDLRHILSRMERYYHGNSSGTDPLVSLLDQPLLLSGGAAPTKYGTSSRVAGAVDLPPLNTTGIALFLLDTGHTRQSGKLIERFLAAYDDTTAENAEDSHEKYVGDLIRNEWMPAVERAIDARISGDVVELYENFAAISDFQLVHFPDFIPTEFHDCWNGGDTYRLKLCGAGGGGMLLGLTRDVEAAVMRLGDGLFLLES